MSKREKPGWQTTDHFFTKSVPSTHLLVLQPDTQFDGFNVLKEDTAKLYIVGKRKTNGIRIHLSSK
jgi:hypothetical protein